MKRKEIEKKLNKTISNMTPDVIDNILAQCENREGVMDMKVNKDENLEKV